MNQRFDYVICGAGPAGCVLANRLSSDPNISVALLEAGPSDWHPYLRVPAGFAKLTGRTATWGYATTAQQHMHNRTMWYPQGKVLGGGSSINAQLYNRGQAADYDSWANDYGCTGWSFSECLPYFKRAESNNRIVNEYHNTDGPLKISDPIPTPMTLQFVQACQQAGFPINTDFNGASQAGFGVYQVTNRDGIRSSASSCYLKPIRSRANLKVFTNAQADQIVIGGKTATGVVCRHNGRKRLLHVQKEVLVTAGAIGSPKLLMLSGIGPADPLRMLGIDVVSNLPGVGSNLHDHMDAFVVAQCRGNYSFDKYKSLPRFLAACIQYALFKTGPAASNICDGGGFWFSRDQLRRPNLQFHFLPGSGLEHGISKIDNGITLNSAFLKPYSRGSVQLQSSEPHEQPLINPNYWGDDRDIAHSVRGLQISRTILAQPALASLLRREVLPGPGIQSREQIMDYIREYAKTDYHPVGTCRMGNPRQSSSVVAPDLKVKGLRNIRVCDSSVMPEITSSNTNAPTIMIAEKAADLIRGTQLAPIRVS